MDLTDFMHGDPAPLLSCALCGIGVRDEPERASYESDVYDSNLMKHLYPRYLRAFRQKEPHFRELLRPRAEVLEVGSHLGAFLQAAEEWEWRPTGLDVGQDTSSFARRLGARVIRQSIEDARIQPRSADAVFIWNCFEQIENPGSALRAARSKLKRDGLLIVRVPNFEYYRRAGRSSLMLGYNNLLGFPYRFGYTPESLSALLRQHGFRPVAALNSTLLTMPFPELTPEVRCENQAAFSRYAGSRFVRPESAEGPWMEIVARVGR